MTGPKKHEYTASLRVFGESLADLVTALGEPTKSYDAGDPVSSRNPDGSRRTSALWSLRSRAQRTQPLDEHIEELVTFIEAHSREFAELGDKAQVDIFCGLFAGDGTQGGFTLTSDLIRRLGAHDIDVCFELY